MRWLLPDTLGGRIVLVLLVGLTASHLGSLWLHSSGTQALVGTTREEQLAERLASTRRALAALPAEERDPTAHALSSAMLDMHWTAAPTVRSGDTPGARALAIRARLLELAPELAATGLRIGPAGDALPPGSPHQLAGALQLPDGSWLNFAAALFRPLATEHEEILSTSAMMLGILLIGLLVVRLIGKPLRELAAAADRVGGPSAAAAVPEDGPREVRHAARAFNRMQARIDRLISDRTQALAAVSHDLRTPIARLRLRSGFVEDAETRRKMETDLDEMEAMIASTLAYLRGDAEQETPRMADLAAVVATICDDASDAGRPVSYEGPSQARLLCRPLALKRAIGNLVDNAVRYGRTARVRLQEDKAFIIVTVEDEGPGIPEAELETAFEPFRRLDPSRTPELVGSGLGLTIARQVAERHGGTVSLGNRPGGGLIAHLSLPRGIPMAAQPIEATRRTE